MKWWRRRAAREAAREADRENDMRHELEALAALAREQGEPNALGNLTRAAENAREAWSWMWLDRLAQDLRYAARSLRAQPGFACARPSLRL